MPELVIHTGSHFLGGRRETPIWSDNHVVFVWGRFFFKEKRWPLVDLLEEFWNENPGYLPPKGAFTVHTWWWEL
jgi:hypothetical protein